jgi:threonylcarbamoyladenosine tRNA methylthiotransferase MtaB
MDSFFVQNFGCRATQADGAALDALLVERGLRRAATTGEAAVVVLNSCTVTSAADEDLRQTVRRLRRENPEVRILVTGCYAQRAPQEVAALPGVEWVVGNSHKGRIPDVLVPAGGGVAYHGNVHVGPIGSEILTASFTSDAGDRTRPNLKIQDGCNNVCTFCIIPSVRGRSRSLPADDVVTQARLLGERYREVVISGINLGRWGREPGAAQPGRLAGLLRRLLDETAIDRIRLSSIEPMDLSEDLLELMASSPRIARHVHAPLQSGCDAVLKRMKRRYRTRHYADRLLRARAMMPDAAIGADVMTGFPGESDAEFEESRRFIESMPYTYLHVFTYSERETTPAAGYPGAVPVPARKERNGVLRRLAARKNLDFRRQFVGSRLSVVTLEGRREGLSSNFLRVGLAGGYAPNTLADVRIGAVTECGLAEDSPFYIHL